MHVCVCFPATRGAGNDSFQRKICISRQVVGKHRQTHSHADVHKRCRLFCPILLNSVPLCTVFRCQIWLVMPDYDSYYSHYFVINSCLPGMLWYVLRQNRVLINMSDWYNWLFCCCQKEQLHKFMPVCTPDKNKPGSVVRKDKKCIIAKRPQRQAVTSSEISQFFKIFLCFFQKTHFIVKLSTSNHDFKMSISSIFQPTNSLRRYS